MSKCWIVALTLKDLYWIDRMSTALWNDGDYLAILERMFAQNVMLKRRQQ